MPYKAPAQPLHVDLSALGETPEGVGFYVRMHTWHTLPAERLQTIKTAYPEFFTQDEITGERAWCLLTSPAYAAVAGALVEEWNLTDVRTDAKLAIPVDDPTVVERVPRVVWNALWAALARAIRPQPSNLVAMTPGRK